MDKTNEGKVMDYESLYRFMSEKRYELENEIAKLKQEIELWQKIVVRLINK